MDKLRVLEDLTYHGRTGGYVARITSKLIDDAIDGGYKEFFVGSHSELGSMVVLALKDGLYTAVLSIPSRFFDAVLKRLCGTCGVSSGSSKGSMVKAYNNKSYFVFLHTIDFTDRSGIAISICDERPANFSSTWANMYKKHAAMRTNKSLETATLTHQSTQR